MGTEYAIGYGRNPKEEKMKKLKDIDLISVVFIILGLVALLAPIAGCSHGFYVQGHRVAKVDDPRQCCQRLSLHHKEMSQFNRYCKVALFLSKGKKGVVGKGVRENANTAVKICKFVFNVDTDDELIAAGDEQEYYRVRSYIVPATESPGWRKQLDCDPQEPSCEEF